MALCVRTVILGLGVDANQVWARLSPTLSLPLLTLPLCPSCVRSLLSPIVWLSDLIKGRKLALGRDHHLRDPNSS